MTSLQVLQIALDALVMAEEFIDSQDESPEKRMDVLASVNNAATELKVHLSSEKGDAKC